MTHESGQGTTDAARRAGNLVIGIDGGGSKTTALLADAEGSILGRGTGGPSNYLGVGADAAQAALDRAIAAAFADAGLPQTPIAALCLGLAGMDRPEDRAVFEAWAARQHPGARACLVNDAELVLAAGTPEGWGVALICGTGSIAYGRSPEGTKARVGGWGYLLGDEGSGYAIGLAALRSVMRAHDGRGPQTALAGPILAHWSAADPPGLVTQVYGRTISPSHIAALAALVEAAADEGDEVARGILREAGGELALAVRAVVRQMGVTNRVPCALAGSVLLKGHWVRDQFLEAAQVLGLELDPVTPAAEPARGAIRLARRLLTP